MFCRLGSGAPYTISAVSRTAVFASYVDSRISASPSLYLRGDGPAHRHSDVVLVLRTPVDIFPEINIPVVSVVWNLHGFRRREMADRIVSNSERGFTVTVNDIEHQESQSLQRNSGDQDFLPALRQYCDGDDASNGDVPDRVARIARRHDSSAGHYLHGSSTPIVQLGLSSKTLPEQQLFDLGQNFLRTQLTTVQGAGTPYPFGGKPRQMQVDLDSAKLQAYGLAPADIVNAVAAQNLILPAGTTKIGPTEYNVEMNGTPQTIAELNDLPVKTTNSSTLYLRDVAHVRDGFGPQTNIVRQDGSARRADVDVSSWAGLHADGGQSH